MQRQFSTDLGQPSMGEVYRMATGQPVGPIQNRQARETSTVLMALAENEQDPAVKQYLINAIRGNSFAGMTPAQAHMAALSIVEQKRAENMNLERDKTALSLLAGEIPDLPADLVEKFGLTAGTTGARADRLTSDVLSRVGRERAGYQTQEQRLAEEEAARRGVSLSSEDQARIRARSVGLYGRRQADEMGQLRRELETTRTGNIRQLNQNLQDVTYRPSDYSSLAAASQGGMSTPSGIRRVRYGGGTGGGSYGVSMVGGNSAGTNGGVNASGTSRYRPARTPSGYIDWSKV